jgi:hypothetical protein
MRFDPRIKPPQWGPVSSVQAAVRHNCQRLGLPLPTGYWPMWENAGSYAHDLISGHASELKNGADWVSGGVEFDATTEHIHGPNGGTLLNSAGTILIGYRQTNTPGTHYYWLALDDDWAEFSLYYNASVDLDFYINSTEGTLSTDPPPWIDGSFHNMGVSWDESYSGGHRWAYDDGSVFSDIPSDIIWDASGVDDHDLRIGGRESGATRYAGGIYYYFAVFGERLTDDQIALLHEQPYALIQPVARTRYFIPDAEPSEPGTGRGQLILISDGLKVMSPAAWAGVCGMSGVIRNPKLTKREMLNPLNWLRK